MSFIKEPPISQRHGIISPLAKRVNLDNLKKDDVQCEIIFGCLRHRINKDTIDQRFLKHH